MVNMADKDSKRTEFSQIGRAAAVEALFKDSGFENRPASLGKGDFFTHKVMSEGVDFDLVYNPLRHLGYKAALNVLGEIYAAFYRPKAISVVLGISARFCLEDVAELWAGVVAAAKEHSVESLSLDLNPSVNGLSISLGAFGSQKKKVLDSRPAAKSMDLICLSGNVGAAYMGQHVLEREKASFVAASSEDKQPDLSKYKYILAQYLCPEVQANTIDRFLEQGIVPSAGAFVTKGLAEAVKKLSAATGLGAKVYVDKIPISSHTFDMAEEINMDVFTAAMNGGDDYRLLFTVPIEKHELLSKEIQTYDIIGHLCRPDVGCQLVTPEGAEIEIKAL